MEGPVDFQFRASAEAPFDPAGGEKHLQVLHQFKAILDSCSENGSNLDAFLAYAQARHAMFFRFMKSGHQDNHNFVPPWDVALLWHTHLLSPFAYLGDYNDGYKMSSVHRQQFEFPLGRLAQLAQSENWTDEPSRSIWRKHFPNQPYQLWATNPRLSAIVTSTSRLDKLEAISGNHTAKNGFTIDLIEAVKRQRQFIEKATALAGLKTREGMEKASRRYHQFMMLMKNDKKDRGMLVPTLDIDLFWHTHQLFNFHYLDWCDQHIGNRINHDDTIDQKGLSQGRVHTRDLWLKIYGESYDSCSHQSVRKNHGNALLAHVSTQGNGQVLSVYAVGNHGDDDGSGLDSDSAEDSAGCGDNCGGGCGGEGGCGNGCGSAR